VAPALLHQASLKTETREVPARPVATLPQATAKSTDKPANAAKPAQTKSVEKLGLAAAQPQPKKPAVKPALAAPKEPPKKSVDKPAVLTAKAVTKPIRIAKVDPLAPLPAKHSANSKGFTAER
jgi:hypothetical protein